MKMNSARFLDIIREEMEGLATLSEQETKIKKSPSLEDWLPTLKITESWGKVKDPSRKMLKLFVNQINKATREANTFEGRIVSLANFIKDDECPSSLARTFARIMMLDLLSTVAEEFTASAGGFILEALAAALSGYRGRQVDEPVAGSLPIVDFTDGEIPYSLKLLTGDPEGRGRSGESGVTKGSVNNLLTHLVNEQDYVRYVVAYRDANDLTFVGFDITLKNVGQIFALRGDKDNKALFGLTAKEVRKKNGKQLYKLFLKLKGSGELGKTQFVFTRKNIEDISNSVTIASIPISKSMLRAAAQRCTERLKAELIPMYRALKELTDNTNLYFLSKNPKKRQSSADKIMDIVTVELIEGIQQAGIGEFEETE